MFPLVPFFELHFRNYNFKEKHFNDEKINNWFCKLTNKNEKKYSIDIYKDFTGWFTNIVHQQTMLRYQFFLALEYKKIMSQLKLKREFL